MDWDTLGVGIVALLGGGVLGFLANIYTTRKQSADRQADLNARKDELALEREKWEHERDQPIRERQREVLTDSLAHLNEMAGFMMAGFNDHPERLHAVIDGTHEARIHAGMLTSARNDLLNYSQPDVANLFDVVLVQYDEALRARYDDDDDAQPLYREFFDAAMAAERACRAALARIN
jgi:hypothetical protein